MRSTLITFITVGLGGLVAARPQISTTARIPTTTPSTTTTSSKSTSTTASVCTNTIPSLACASPGPQVTYLSQPCFPRAGVCYPTNYYAAQDQGQMSASNGNFDTQVYAKCKAVCESQSQCNAFVGIENITPDGNLATGTCFLYSSQLLSPRQCSDSPSRILAYYKQQVCPVVTTTTSSSSTTSSTTKSSTTTSSTTKSSTTSSSTTKGSTTTSSTTKSSTTTSSTTKSSTTSSSTTKSSTTSSTTSSSTTSSSTTTKSSTASSTTSSSTTSSSTTTKSSTTTSSTTTSSTTTSSTTTSSTTTSSTTTSSATTTTTGAGPGPTCTANTYCFIDINMFVTCGQKYSSPGREDSTTTATSAVDCASQCARGSSCSGFNFMRATGICYQFFGDTGTLTADAAYDGGYSLGIC